MSKSRLPDGVIPPVLTPLTADQEVDVPALKALIKHLIDGGSSALFVGGTAGLGSILTAADYELVVSTALETVPSGYPVLCGVLEPSTARALERIKLLESLNVEFFVTVTPYYVKTTDEEALLRHFGLQRDATDMEMVLYNMPGCTGVSIPQSLVQEMVKREWTFSCKDSSGDKAYFETLCKGSQETGLKVYQGMCPDFGWLQSLGAAGCVPVPANAHPELFSGAWNSRADAANLPKLQSEVDRVWNELVVGTDYTSKSLKHLAQNGIGCGTMALPF
mgnify:CR=1 FL=1